jgi:hypothetical protein
MVDASWVTVEADKVMVDADIVIVVAGGVGAVDTSVQFTTPMIVTTEGWPPNFIVRSPVLQLHNASPSAELYQRISWSI